MDSLKKNQSVFVHAYKHNGTIYRSWEKPKVFFENEEMLVLINEEVLVTEINGRKWKTNEPAMWFFFKNGWFNIICMFKEKGINYYCNMASPYLVEGNTIKYVDYDLDIKVFNDNSYKILDLREFLRNRLSWGYGQKLVDLIWENVEQLKKKIAKKSDCFSHNYVLQMWNEYKNGEK